MDEKKNSTDFNVSKDGMDYLTTNEVQEIVQGFELLQISTLPQYANPYQFSKDLQRATNLQFEGVRFFTSGSTSPTKD